jgi:hypothetical protein
MASIKKRPDGRWRARYRDPAGKEHAKHFERKVDAERWLDGLRGDLARGEYVDPKRGRLTAGEWADTWMSGRVHLKPKTLASYSSLLRTRIRPAWEARPLVGITNAEVVAWVASMRSAGLSPSRVRQAYHLFSTMLEAAVRDRRLASNPAAGVDLPRLHGRNVVTSTTQRLRRLLTRAVRIGRSSLSSVTAGSGGGKPPRCACEGSTRCAAGWRSVNP